MSYTPYIKECPSPFNDGETWHEYEVIHKSGRTWFSGKTKRDLSETESYVKDLIKKRKTSLGVIDMDKNAVDYNTGTFKRGQGINLSGGKVDG